MGCCDSRGPNKLPEIPPDDSRQVSVGVGKEQVIAHKQNSIRLDYDVVKLLGEGTLGQVFLLKDKRNGALKTMKEIPKSQLTQSQTEQLLREVEILKDIVRNKSGSP